MDKYFCGIEGGTSSSEVVILNSSGKLLSKICGPGLNPWLLGDAQTITRIVSLVNLALKDADIPPETLLGALGLALSGIDTDADAREFEKTFVKTQPLITETIYACNDTLGALFAVTDKGGIVLVAGTGSNCRLYRPDLSFCSVGGYGHMLGDEGSGFWITYRVIKTYVDHDEGLIECPYDTSLVKEAIFEHFALSNNLDLLGFLYSFEKAKFSSLCQKFALLANRGDELTRSVFHKAGFFLGAHVMAVLRKSGKNLSPNPEGVVIVCRGSVFKSWDLLKNGFEERVMTEMKGGTLAKHLRLVFLCSPAACGAAFLVAHIRLQMKIPQDHKTLLLAEFHA